MTSARGPQKRPAWRRVAGRMRRAFHLGLTVVDRLRPARRDPLLPPARLRIYYYRTADPAAFAHACASARAEVLNHGLAPHHRTLDVGSGIGNLALGLKDVLPATYVGLEIHPEAVSWCQRAITPRYPTFRFHRADVASRAFEFVMLGPVS